jgi:hypothetical protein
MRTGLELHHSPLRPVCNADVVFPDSLIDEMRMS